MPGLTFRYVTRVAGIPKDGGPYEHRGTALLCMIEGRQAFITADHVVTEMAKEDRFAATALSCVSETKPASTLHFEDIDIAVLIPTETVDVRDGKQFWPSERADITTKPLPADYLITHGYPDSFSRFSAFGPSYVSETYVHCTSIRLKGSDFRAEKLEEAREHFPNYLPVPDDLLRPGQFAINYAEEAGPLMSPYGEEIVRPGMISKYSALYRDGTACLARSSPELSA